MLNCGAAVLDAGSGNTATMVMTATPRSTGGWQFVGWQNCPAPAGNTCTITAIGISFPIVFGRARCSVTSLPRS